MFAPVRRPPVAELASDGGGLPPVQAECLAYASLAPSSHNAQPWKVKLEPPLDWRIVADPARRFPAVDPLDRELILSLAGFVETLVQAGAALGLGIEIDLVDGEPRELPALKVRTSVVEAVADDSILRLIEGRATTRAPFEQRELRPEHCKALLRLSPDHAFYIPGSTPQGKWIADSLPLAMERQVADDAKQAELATWLRFSRTDAEERGDGLTAEAQGLSGLPRTAWYALFNEKRAMGGLFRSLAVRAARRQAGHASGFLVLTSRDTSVAALVACGRLYQRCLLAATAAGVAHHTMSQLIEEAPWNERLQETLGLIEPIQFVVRLGYSNVSAPASIRRPVRAFVESV